MTSCTVYLRTNYVLLISHFIWTIFFLSPMLWIWKFSYQYSVHYVAMHLTLFIFSESVITSDGCRQGYVRFAHSLLYFESRFVGNLEDRICRIEAHIISEITEPIHCDAWKKFCQYGPGLDSTIRNKIWAGAWDYNNLVCATSKGSDQPAHMPSDQSLC